MKHGRNDSVNEEGLVDSGIPSMICFCLEEFHDMRRCFITQISVIPFESNEYVTEVGQLEKYVI